VPGICCESTGGEAHGATSFGTVPLLQEIPETASGELIGTVVGRPDAPLLLVWECGEPSASTAQVSERKELRL
jgi:hypothetical protein